MKWTVTDSTTVTEPVVTECVADAVEVLPGGVLRFTVTVPGNSFTDDTTDTVMLHRLSEGHTVTPES